ncbi:hypothetical protein Hdeb2414_s0015g00451741 [Helianthus debilis subsp. tardiflorus]
MDEMSTADKHNRNHLIWFLSFIRTAHHTQQRENCVVAMNVAVVNNLMAKLEIFDRGDVIIGPKNFYNTGGIENIYTQKFQYENYILSTTD